MPSLRLGVWTIRDPAPTPTLLGVLGTVVRGVDEGFASAAIFSSASRLATL